MHGSLVNLQFHKLNRIMHIFKDESVTLHIIHFKIYNNKFH